MADRHQWRVAQHQQGDPQNQRQPAVNRENPRCKAQQPFGAITGPGGLGLLRCTARRSRGAEHFKSTKVHWCQYRHRRHQHEKSAHPADKRAPQMHRGWQPVRIIKQRQPGGAEIRHHLDIGVQECSIRHRPAERHGQHQGQAGKCRHQRQQIAAAGPFDHPV